MVWARILTGAILIVVVTALVFAGGRVLFTAAVALVAVGGAWEFFRLTGVPSRALGAGALLGAALLPVAMALNAWGLVAALFGLVVAVGLLSAVADVSRAAARLSDTGRVLTCLTYVPLLLGYLAALRSVSAEVVYTVLLVTWSQDVGAYAAGSAWGRHKMAPTVSPGKTWEGAGGGLVVAAGIAFLARAILLPDLNPAVTAGLAVLIAVAGPLGDLAESALKRLAATKDSGRLFPGHGGVLDRVDSLLFAAPAAYYYLRVAVW